MGCALRETVAVGIGLCLQHQFVELADAQRAPLATSEDLGLEQETAADVHHDLGGPLQVDVEEGKPVAAL